MRESTARNIRGSPNGERKKYRKHDQQTDQQAHERTERRGKEEREQREETKRAKAKIEQGPREREPRVHVPVPGTKLGLPFLLGKGGASVPKVCGEIFPLALG